MCTETVRWLILIDIDAKYTVDMYNHYCFLVNACEYTKSNMCHCSFDSISRGCHCSTLLYSKRKALFCSRRSWVASTTSPLSTSRATTSWRAKTQRRVACCPRHCHVCRDCPASISATTAPSTSFGSCWRTSSGHSSTCAFALAAFANPICITWPRRTTPVHCGTLTLARTGSDAKSPPCSCCSSPLRRHYRCSRWRTVISRRQTWTRCSPSVPCSRACATGTSATTTSCARRSCSSTSRTSHRWRNCRRCSCRSPPTASVRRRTRITFSTRRSSVAASSPAWACCVNERVGRTSRFT